MKKFILILCIPFTLIAASFYEFGTGAGYRQDRLEFTMFNDLGLTIIDEDFHSLRSVELEGYFKGVYKFLYIYGHADYAWIQSGTLDLFPSLNPGIATGGSPNTVPFEFHNKVRHKLYDVDGCIGLTITLWEREKNRRGLLVFFGGYSLHRQVLTLAPPEPDRDNNTDIAAAFPLFSLASFAWDQSVGKTNWTWWGSFVGANLDIKPLDCLEFELAYSFHPMKMELRFDAFTSNQLFILIPPPFLTTLTETRVRAKFEKALGHKIRGRTSYSIFPWWKLGLSGSYFHVTTDRKKSGTLSQNSRIFVGGGEGINFFSILLNSVCKWQTFDILFETTFSY